MGIFFFAVGPAVGVLTLTCVVVTKLAPIKMKTFILVLAVCIALSQAVKIRDCGSQADVNLKDIKITGCSDDVDRCTFIRGKIAHISLPFTPKSTVSQLTSSVHGIIAGVPIPFPLPESDACKSTEPGCPLQSGNLATYTFSLPVKSIFPPVSLDVKWELKDQNGSDQVCIIFPVKLV